MITFIKLNESTAARRRVPIYLVDDTDGKTPEPNITTSGAELQVSEAFGGWVNGTGGSIVEEGGAGNGVGHYYYELAAGECDTAGVNKVKVVKTGCRTFVALYFVTPLDLWSAVFGLPLPAALISGRIDATVGAMQSGVLSAAAIGSNAITAAKVATDLDARLADAVCDEALSGHLTAGSVGAALNKLIYPTGAVVANGGNTASSFVTNLTEAGTDYWKDCFLRFTAGANVGAAHRISAYNGSTKAVTLATAFAVTPTAADAFEIINR